MYIDKKFEIVKIFLVITCSDCSVLIHLCVYPLVDHGQQPMKMHTEVTLLYNDILMNIIFI